MDNYRKVTVTDLFQRNELSKSATVINKGGAGSSKSHSLCQVFIYRLTTRNNYKLLISRKTLPALKISAYKLFIDLLKDYDYYQHCDHNKSERTLKIGTNYVHFTGIDDPEKIKSTEWNDIWMEEANEFTYDDYLTLQIRNRAPGYHNQIFLSLNPVDENVWINTKVISQEDCDVIHSTYRDNPFLPDVAKQQIENLKNIDENYYKIYALGEWGGLIRGKIFQYEVFDKEPECKWTSYGLDWGYSNDPTALIRVGYTSKALYLTELIYETGLTNDDISKKMDSCLGKTDEIIADSAEPKSIEELHRARWNIHPARKGKDSIIHGIDLMKRYTIKVHRKSVHLQKELNQYKWAEDKNGDLLSKPIDMFNHGIDAVRYVCLNKLQQKKQLIFA